MTYIKKAKAKSQTNFYTNSKGEKKFIRKLGKKPAVNYIKEYTFYKD